MFQTFFVDFLKLVVFREVKVLVLVRAAGVPLRIELLACCYALKVTVGNGIVLVTLVLLDYFPVLKLI